MNNKEKTITYFCFYPNGNPNCDEPDNSLPLIFIEYDEDQGEVSSYEDPDEQTIKNILLSNVDEELEGWCHVELDSFKEWVVENRSEVLDEMNKEDEITEEDVSPVALEYVKEMKKNGTWNPEKEKSILKWGAAIKKSTDETLKMQRDLLKKELKDAGDAPPENDNKSYHCGVSISSIPISTSKIEPMQLFGGDDFPIIKDDVNHPTHYKNHPSGVECIDITEHMSFCLGNAVKYIWRCEEKHNDGGEKDLKKAIWYLNRELKRRFNKTEEEKPTELFPEKKHIDDVTVMDAGKVNYVGTEGNEIIFDYEGEVYHVDVSILSSSFQSLSWCCDVMDVWKKKIDPKHEPLGMVDLENQQLVKWAWEERQKKFERERHIDNALKPRDKKGNK